MINIRFLKRKHSLADESNKTGKGIIHPRLSLLTFLLLSILLLIPQAQPFLPFSRAHTAEEPVRQETVTGSTMTITYLDEAGEPMKQPAGYTRILRHLDENGRARTDFYLDARGKPVRLTLGYYGVEYQRDASGQIERIIYLDADGEPTKTTAGYTAIRRSYDREGQLEADFYEDADGKPMALSKGQYGIKYADGVTLYLNRNGKVMLCVDNLLNGYPWTVVLLGTLLCLAMVLLPDRLRRLLLLAYLGFILYETFLFREIGDARTNFVLFSYRDSFWSSLSVRVGVIHNIWLFVPLGAGLRASLPQKKWVLLIPLLLSIAIEAGQYFTGLGIAELDDVFGNSLGGLIGCYCYSRRFAICGNFRHRVAFLRKI